MRAGVAVGWIFWPSVLTVSLVAYARTDALDHFIVHLVYGASAGLVTGVALHATRVRIPRDPATWALLGYGFMVVPDILWLLPQVVGGSAWEHAAWMNVFLGHVVLDQWPGTWIAIWPAIGAGAAAWWWLHRRRRGPAAPTAAPTEPGAEA